MFESVLERYLFDWFGEFVDFDKENLRLSIWQGDITLNDLVLKKGALDVFELPLDVESGYLKKLHVHVPWTKLSSSPVKISIDGLYILCKPWQNRSAFHSDSADRLASSIKRKRLKEIELLRERERYLFGNNSDKPNKKKESMYQRVLAKIIENLQLTVKNVHLRYEDHTTMPTHAFAVGLMIKEVSIHSTDPEGNIRFVEPEKRRDTHKAAFVKHLSIYWDSNLTAADLWLNLSLTERMIRFRQIASHNHHLTRNISSPNQRHQRFLRNRHIKTHKTLNKNVKDKKTNNIDNDYKNEDDSLNLSRYRFILHPLYCKIRIVLSNDVYTSSESELKQRQNDCTWKPRYTLEAEVDSPTIDIHEHAVRDALKLADELATMQVAYRMEYMLSAKGMRIIRPENSPLRNKRVCKQWWQYIIRSVIHFNELQHGSRFKMNSQTILQHARDRKRYIPLYNRYRNDLMKQRKQEYYKWLTPLTEGEKPLLELLEDRLTIDAIVIFRSLADTELQFQVFQKTAHDLRKQQQRKLAIDSAETARSQRRSWAGWMINGMGNVLGISRGMNLSSPDSQTQQEEYAHMVRLTNDQRRSLYTTIDFDDTVKKWSLPSNYVYFHVSLALKSLSLSIVQTVDNISLPLANISVSGHLYIDGRPTSSITRLEVEQLSIREDWSTDASKLIISVGDQNNVNKNVDVTKNTKSTSLGNTVTSTNKKNEPVMKASWEVKPTHVDPDAFGDIRINVHLAPVEIIYLPLWINRVISFCQLITHAEVVNRSFNTTNSTNNMRNKNSWSKWAAQKRLKLMDKLRDPMLIELDVCIDRPTLVVFDDSLSRNSRILVGIISQIIMKSTSPAKLRKKFRKKTSIVEHQNTNMQQTSHNIYDIVDKRRKSSIGYLYGSLNSDDDVYDSFGWSLKGVSVLSYSSYNTWKTKTENIGKIDSVVRSFSVNFEAKVLVEKLLGENPDFSIYPRLIISGGITPVDITLNTSTFHIIHNIKKQWPSFIHNRKQSISMQKNDNKTVHQISTDNNRSGMDVQFSLVLPSVDMKLNDLIQMNLTELVIESSMNSIQSNLKLLLGSWTVEDLRQYGTGQLRYLVDTRHAANLFDCNIENQNKNEISTDSDDLKNEMRHFIALDGTWVTTDENQGGIEGHINVRFDALKVNWNPETVVEVINFLEVPVINDDDDVDKDNLNEDNLVSNVQLLKDNGELYVCVWHLEMNRFELNFNKDAEQRQLVTLIMDQADVCIIQHLTTRSIQGKLANIHLTDQTQDGTFYKHLMTQVETGRPGDVIFWYTNSAQNHTLPNEFKKHHKFNNYKNGSWLIIHINSVKIVYLQQMFEELWDYVRQGVLAAVTANIQKRASNEIWKEKAAQIDDILHLDIYIDQPTLLIPRHFSSPSHIEIHASHLHISNYMSELGAILEKFIEHQLTIDGHTVGDIQYKPLDMNQQWPHSTLAQIFLIDVPKIQLKSYVCGVEQSRMVVKNADIKFQLAFPWTDLENIYSYYKPHALILGTFSPLYANLSLSQYVLLVNVLLQNISASPVSTSNENVDNLASTPMVVNKIQYSYADQSTPPTYKRWCLKFQGLEVNLLPSYAGSKSMTPFALLNVSRLYYLNSLQSTALGSLSRIVAMSLQIKRNNNIFTKLLCPLREIYTNTNDEQLSSDLDIAWKSTKRQRCISMEFKNPCGFLLPDVICHLINYFDIAHHIVSSYSTNMENDHNKIERPLDIEVTIKNAHMIVLDDMLDKNCRAVATTFDAYCRYQYEIRGIYKKKKLYESSFNLTVSNLEMFVCTANNPSVSAANSLLSPSSFTTTYRTHVLWVDNDTPSNSNINNGRIVKSNEIAAQFHDIELRVSYQDSKLLFHMVKHLKRLWLKCWYETKNDQISILKVHYEQVKKENTYTNEHNISSRIVSVLSLSPFLSGQIKNMPPSPLQQSIESTIIHIEDMVGSPRLLSHQLLDQSNILDNVNVSDNAEKNATEFKLNNDDYVESLSNCQQNRTIINITFDSFTFLIINDYGGIHMPLMHTHISSLSIDSTINQNIHCPECKDTQCGGSVDPISSKISAELSLEADGYRGSQVTWQPLIEPLNLIISHTKSKETSILTIEGVSSFQINISKEFIDTLQETLHDWTLDIQRPLRKTQFSPFIICNYSGTIIHTSWIPSLDNSDSSGIDLGSDFQLMMSPRLANAHHRWLTDRKHRQQLLKSNERSILKISEQDEKLFANLIEHSGNKSLLTFDVQLLTPETKYDDVSNIDKHTLIGSIINVTYDIVNNVKIDTVGTSSYVLKQHAALTKKGGDIEVVGGEGRIISKHNVKKHKSNICFKPRLFVDVSLCNGSKIVTFRSAIQLRNFTNVPLVFRLCTQKIKQYAKHYRTPKGGILATISPNMSKGKSSESILNESNQCILAPIQPGDVAYLPIDMLLSDDDLKMLILMVKPVSTQQYNWSSRVIHPLKLLVLPAEPSRVDQHTPTSTTSNKNKLSTKWQLKYQEKSGREQPLVGKRYDIGGTKLKCETNKNDDNDSYYCHIEAAKYVDTQFVNVSNGQSTSNDLGQGLFRLCLTIHPPLVLQNHFPRSMFYRIIYKDIVQTANSKSSPIITNGIVQSNDEICLNNVDMNKKPLISIRLDGLNWSNYVSIVEEINRRHTHRPRYSLNIKLRDRENRMISTVLDIFAACSDPDQFIEYTHTAGALILRFYAHFWLVNTTGVCIEYGGSETSSRNASMMNRLISTDNIIRIGDQQHQNRFVEELWEYDHIENWNVEHYAPKLPKGWYWLEDEWLCDDWEDYDPSDNNNNNINNNDDNINNTDNNSYTVMNDDSSNQREIKDNNHNNFDDNGYKSFNYSKEEEIKENKSNNNIRHRRCWSRTRCLNPDAVGTSICLYSLPVKSNGQIQTKNIDIQHMLSIRINNNSTTSKWSPGFNPRTTKKGTLTVSCKRAHNSPYLPLSLETIGKHQSNDLSSQQLYEGGQGWKFRYDFGISVLPQNDNLSSIISFLPRYTLVNHSSHCVYIRQGRQKSSSIFKEDRTIPSDVLQLHSEHHSAWYWRETKSHSISLSIESKEVEWSWSNPVRIDHIGDTSVMIHSLKPSGEYLLLQLRIKSRNAGLFIVISEVDKSSPPYRFDNFTGHTMYTRQYIPTMSNNNNYNNININDNEIDGWFVDSHNMEDELNNENSRVPRPSFAPLSNGRSIPYAWSEPTMPAPRLLTVRLFMYETFVGVRVPLDHVGFHRVLSGERLRHHLIEEGNLSFEKSRDPPTEKPTIEMMNMLPPSTNDIIPDIHIVIYASNITKVLFVGELKYMPTHVYLQLTSKTSIKTLQKSREINKNKEVSLRQVIVRFNQVGISFIDKKPQEVAYCMLTKLHFGYSRNAMLSHWELWCDKLSFDSQLDIELLTPQCIRTHDQNNNRPFIHFAAIRHRTSTSELHFKYIGLAIQSFHVNLEEVFVTHLIPFFQNNSNTKSSLKILKENYDNNNQDKQQLSFYDSCQLKLLGLIDILELNDEIIDPTMIIIDELEILPIKFTLTFRALPGDDRRNNNDENINSNNGLISNFSLLLSNIDNAPLYLDGKCVKNSTLRYDMLRHFLIQPLIDHYMEQFFSQAPRMLGSASILGSPIGLVNEVGSGMYDLVYKPAQGILKGPGQFGLGIAQGVGSFVKHSVSGIAHSASLITRTMGSGIASLSVDARYMRRRARRLTNRPNHALSGIVESSQHLSRGIVDAISGLFESPISGAQQDGMSGFFKGLATGVVGLVVKPITGVFDAASSLTDGVANTTRLLDENYNEQRLRLPRMMYGNAQIFRVYSEDDATIRWIYSHAFGGMHKNEAYEDHVIIRPPNLQDSTYEPIVLILLKYHLLCLRLKKLSSKKWRELWKVQWKDVVFGVKDSNLIVSYLNQRSELFVFSNNTAQRLCQTLRTQQQRCS